eukprot:scaffold111836_cov18-Prasinocladus_malaysianus.AAC.1
MVPEHRTCISSMQIRAGGWSKMTMYQCSEVVQLFDERACSGLSSTVGHRFMWKFVLKCTAFMGKIGRQRPQHYLQCSQNARHEKLESIVCRCFNIMLQSSVTAVSVHQARRSRLNSEWLVISLATLANS